MVYSLAKNYHEYHFAEVENAIKRYSREANVETGPIKMKQFKRLSAGEQSLETATVSVSKKLKYGDFE